MSTLKNKLLARLENSVACWESVKASALGATNYASAARAKNAIFLLSGFAEYIKQQPNEVTYAADNALHIERLERIQKLNDENVRLALKVAAKDEVIEALTLQRSKIMGGHDSALQLERAESNRLRDEIARLRDELSNSASRAKSARAEVFSKLSLWEYRAEQAAHNERQYTGSQTAMVRYAAQRDAFKYAQDNL